MSQQRGRIEALDALRGFALLGILVVNIQVFSGWGFLGEEGRQSLSWSDRDSELLFGLKVLAHDKFYSLFSLLFGYSFVMLARKKGAGYHLRRMLGLALLGLAHAIFLWPWDILLLYAVVGVLLTPFINKAPGTLFVWALALLLLTGLARWIWLTYEPAAAWSPGLLEALDEGVPIMSGGAYREVVNINLELLVANSLDRLEDLRPVRVMAMFLLGSAAARLHLVEADSGHGRLLGLYSLIGLPLALALAMAEQTQDREGVVFLVAETLAGPMMALGYASVLILWWNHNGPVARGARAALAPAGRMALTNYLAQSAVCVPVFYGLGLGLFAEWSLAKLLLFTGGLFLAQLLASALWLKLFRQGPMEWLWRWQIQGSLPPFRK